jgi:hypothetical protein
MDKIIEFLKANQGWSSFYASLLTQYERKGALSPRQIECVEKNMAKAADREVARSVRAAAPRTFSLLPGQEIEIKGWIAKRLQADLKLDFFFRNLEIVEVTAESKKAYQVKVKFISKIMSSCHFCGRELDNDVSRATGVGPVCAEKHGLGRPTLETAQATIKALEEVCAKIGTVGPFWLPKSQIIGHGCVRLLVAAPETPETFSMALQSLGVA